MALNISCNINGQIIPCSQMPSWAIAIWVVTIIFLFAYGLLNLYKPFVLWSVKFSNRMAGRKTEITPTTIKWKKVSGIFNIIMAIFFLIILLNIR